MGCLKTKQPKQAEAINVWWGSREEIKAFLDSPNAQANDWVIRALR